MMTKTQQMMAWLEGELAKNLSYVWGDKDGEMGKTKGWDCSGLSRGAYASIGITNPDGSFNQIKCGREITLEAAARNPGVLVFKRRKITGRVYHVGIITEGGTVTEAHSTKLGIIKRAYSPKGWSSARKIDELYAP